MTLQETIALAESPKTSPKTLRSLYHNLLHVPEWHRSRIRKKIAGNPNISATLVAEITHWHGRELFKNPVFPLLLMETPDLFSRNSRSNNLYRLLSWEETPKFLLNVLSQHHNPLVAHEAEYHVALHGEYTDDSWIEEVKNALTTSACEMQGSKWMQYWHMCEAFPSWLAQRLRWPPLPRPIRTARIHPHVTEGAPTEHEASQLEQLTNDELLALARHPGQHPDRLRILIEMHGRFRYYDNYWNMYYAICNHPNFPQDLLQSGRYYAQISYYDMSIIDEKVEQSQGNVLSSLAEDLIGHNDASLALCQRALLRLVANPSPYQRNFPPSITFLALLRAEDATQIRFWEADLWWPERLAAALHPDTAPEVRAYIAKDSHRWVRTAARAAQADPNTWKCFWE